MDLDIAGLIRHLCQQLEESEHERTGQQCEFRVQELTIELPFDLAGASTDGGPAVRIRDHGAPKQDNRKLTLTLCVVPDTPSADDESQGAAAARRDPRIQEALGVYPSRKHGK